jgi:hypothetical protein
MAYTRLIAMGGETDTAGVPFSFVGPQGYQSLNFCDLECREKAFCHFDNLLHQFLGSGAKLTITFRGCK